LQQHWLNTTEVRLQRRPGKSVCVCVCITEHNNEARATEQGQLEGFNALHKRVQRDDGEELTTQGRL